MCRTKDPDRWFRLVRQIQMLDDVERTHIMAVTSKPEVKQEDK